MDRDHDGARHPGEHHGHPDHHWDPRPGDADRIREHLERQSGLRPDQVRLDDGRIVDVGSDARGEGDDWRTQP